MRTGHLALALGLLLPACGGGGGGVGDALPAPDPNPSAVARTQALLEACVLEEVAAFEAAAADFDGALDGEWTTHPDFQVTGFDLVTATVEWTLDADADGDVDLEGTARFLDGGGSPTLPFSPATVLALLSGGAPDVAALLATVPDGTTVVVDYATVGQPVGVTGTLETTFLDGQPSTVSGSADFDGTSCDTHVSFTDLAAAALFDPAPAGVFAVEVATTEGLVQGTLTLNGDGTATLDMALDGGDHAVWDYDLATGVLTPRP
jgi:hypothetical protein